jgi:hypothetical protein
MKATLSFARRLVTGLDETCTGAGGLATATLGADLSSGFEGGVATETGVTGAGGVGAGAGVGLCYLLRPYISSFT